MSDRRVLIVVGHGKTESLCHHILHIVQEELERLGAVPRVHDLLSDGFDPVLRLSPGEIHPSRADPGDDPVLYRYQEDVLWADTYVLIHPVWWFAPPAILKGWVDRVLVDGVALEQRPKGPPEGILKGKRALVVQTFNAQKTVDKVVFGSISEYFWKRAVFMPAGIRKVRRVALYSVEEITKKQLEAVRRKLRRALE